MAQDLISAILNQTQAQPSAPPVETPIQDQRNALIRIGLGMMQPVPVGSSPAAVAAQSIMGGLNYMDKQKADFLKQQNAKTELDIKKGLLQAQEEDTAAKRAALAFKQGQAKKKDQLDAINKLAEQMTPVGQNTTPELYGTARYLVTGKVAYDSPEAQLYVQRYFNKFNIDPVTATPKQYAEARRSYGKELKSLAVTHAAAANAANPGAPQIPSTPKEFQNWLNQQSEASKQKVKQQDTEQFQRIQSARDSQPIDQFISMMGGGATMGPGGQGFVYTPTPGDVQAIANFQKIVMQHMADPNYDKQLVLQEQQKLAAATKLMAAFQSTQGPASPQAPIMPATVFGGF